MENKLEKIGQNNFMDNFVKTDDILKDMCGIIESSQKAAYRAVNTTLIQRNWLLGYRIASEELQGEDRAKYGAEIIKKLAKELSAEYGKGYTKSNLYSFYSFYKTYPEIFQTPSGKSVGLLSWSRRVDNPAFCFRGRIIEHYYRSKTLKLVTGMRKKPQNKLGVSVLCRGTFLLSIITVCWGLRKKSL